MTWEERLRQGTFREIPITFRESNAELGRRTVVHEFIDRNTPPYVEDLGLRTRSWDITAILIGDDYDIARSDLIQAFETEGPHTFDHPLWGTFVVDVDGPVQVRESDQRGGMCEISVKLIESGQPRSPTITADPKAALQNTATSTISNIQGRFLDSFDVLQQPDAVVQSAVNQIDSVATTLRAARGRITGVTATIDDVGRAIAQLENEAFQFTQLPLQLAQQMLGTIQDLFQLSTDPTFAGDAVASTRAALEQMTNHGTVPEDNTTSSVNTRAFTVLVRAAGVTEAARVAEGISFATLNDATDLLDQIEVGIDAVEDLLDDDTFFSLRQLRVDLRRRVLGEAQQLPTITNYTPLSVLPAVVIAQTLYGDPTRDEELITRNNIRNPARVPQGDPLVVASD